MRRAALLVLFCVAALFAGRDAFAIVEAKEVVSPGGIKAWLVEDHSVPVIAIDFEFAGGSAYDPEGKEGLAYLASGLLDEGAGEMTALAFQQALEEHAIKMGFEARQDWFSGEMKILSSEAVPAFELLGLALSAPRFDQDAVERVRQQVLSMQLYDAQQPRRMAWKIWRAQALEGHPYARFRKGTAESIAAITQADLRAFMARHATRASLRIGVVGDITAQELGPLLDDAFGRLPQGEGTADLPPAPFPKAGELAHLAQDISQSVVIFGAPGLKREDPRWYAWSVLNYVLGGGGFSSRLMEEVRRKRGLTYGVSTSLSSSQEGGLIVGSASTRSARVGETVQVIRDELARIAEDGITEQELADARTYLLGSYPLYFTESDDIAVQLVGVQRFGLGQSYFADRAGLIEAVSLEDVNALAEEFLQPGNFFWLVLGADPGPLEGDGVAHPATEGDN
ncbi:MAG: pitrilysin family protein, partial [Alphaproteobacteria bacterium]|nr:pitrilysin family protein [Alphaproteobacteria bacterium]